MADLKADDTGNSIVPVLACVLNQLCLRNDRLPMSQSGLSKFHALRPPAISIKDYLQRVAKYAACSGECFVLALVYIDRIIQSNPTFVVNSLNIHRLLITSIMLAAKFFDDQYFNNAYYCLSPDTLVVKADGTRLTIDKVAVGDVLAGQDGATVTVDVAKSGLSKVMYKVACEGDRSFTCTPDHLVSLMWTMEPTVEVEGQRMTVRYFDRKILQEESHEWVDVADKSLAELTELALAYADEQNALRAGHVLDVAASYLYDNYGRLSKELGMRMRLTALPSDPANASDDECAVPAATSAQLMGVEELLGDAQPWCGITVSGKDRAESAVHKNTRFALADGTLVHNCKVGGVPCNEINSLEVEFLFMVNFTLFVTTDTYSQYYTELCNHAGNTQNVCNCSQGPKVPPLVIPYVNSPGPGQTVTEWHMQQSPNIPFYRDAVGGADPDLSDQELAQFAAAHQQQLLHQQALYERELAQQHQQHHQQQQQYSNVSSSYAQPGVQLGVPKQPQQQQQHHHHQQQQQQQHYQQQQQHYDMQH